MNARWTARPVSPRQVDVEGGFWGPRLATNRTATAPYLLDMCEKTGRIASLRLEWKEGEEPKPHHFWDSDVAKSLEAVAYVLMAGGNSDLEARADEVISLFERAQQRDGYVNSYFLQVAPEKRFTNLRDDHELYCAGHLIEAAVAYREATGKDRLMTVARRYADLIDGRFGPSGTPGYPGHEEIELALVKLYRSTGDGKYLNLSKAFVDRRGTEPNFFRREAEERRETELPWFHRFAVAGAAEEYWQAHMPVREQTEAVGHAVRAGYLYTAMADLAAETGDEGLLRACLRLWDNITTRRMYITGGVGARRFGESYSVDYDLPNEEAYAESCAAISLALFAQRLSNIEPNRRFADVLERIVYNGMLSGISLDGTHFFYANPLAAHPVARGLPQVAADAARREWYGCACCPPNLSRILGSLGSFAYSVCDVEVWIHLFVQGRLRFLVNGTPVTLEVKTEYPWQGDVSVTVQSDVEVEMGLSLRVPGWCESANARVVPANGSSTDSDSPLRAQTNGYVRVRRRFGPGDEVQLRLPMRPRRVYANPRVRQNGNCVAFERGPLLYCIEEIDNGRDLAALAIPKEATLDSEYRADILGGVVVLRTEGIRPIGDGALYRYDSLATEDVSVMAVPYALWAHRGEGEMRVWVGET